MKDCYVSFGKIEKGDQMVLSMCSSPCACSASTSPYGYQPFQLQWVLLMMFYVESP